MRPSYKSSTTYLLLLILTISSLAQPVADSEDLVTTLSEEKVKVTLLTKEVEKINLVMHELLKSVNKLTKKYVARDEIEQLRGEVELNRQMLDNVTHQGVGESRVVEVVESKLGDVYDIIRENRDSVEAVVEESLGTLESQMKEFQEDLVRRMESKEKRSAVNTDNFVTYDSFQEVAQEVSHLRTIPAQLNQMMKKNYGQMEQSSGIGRAEFAKFQLRTARDTSKLRFNEGQWVMFQQRGQYSNPQNYFARNLSEYVTGFGDLEAEFWLGLDKLELLTKDKAELRVELETFEGVFVNASYSSFSVRGAHYNIHVSGYHGNAGDPLRIDNGMAFSTQDVDRDDWSGSCSETRGQGGWWFNGCGLANLNGLNLGPGKFSYDGILWYFYGRDNRCFKASRMMLRKLL